MSGIQDTNLSVRHDWKEIHLSTGASKCSRCGEVYNGSNGSYSCPKATVATLVERLRRESCHSFCTGTKGCSACIVRHEAADEIKRLRNENAELHVHLANATRFNGGCCGR